MFDAGGTRDRHHLRQAEQPRKRHLRGPGVVGEATPRRVSSSGSARCRFSVPNKGLCGRTPPGRLSTRIAAKQPLGERAVGHHHPIMLFGEGHQVFERAGMGERERDLIAHHRLTQRRVSFLPPRQRVVGYPNRTDPPPLSRLRIPRMITESGTSGLGWCTW